MLAALPESCKAITEGVHALIQSVFDEHALDDMIKDDTDTKIAENALNDNFYKKEFQALWNYINHKYAYTVEFDSEELIKKAIAAMDEKMFVAKLQYTVTTGEQGKDWNADKLKSGNGFVTEKSKTYTLERAEGSLVRYDLVGKVAEGTKLTRRTVAKILAGISPVIFSMFKNNPEEFITKAIRIINEQKATMIVEQITYNQLDGTYDSTIFTAERNTDFTKAYRANKLSHEDILKGLKRTSKYYGAFIGENNYYSKEITGYLRSFHTIKQTTVLPLIFKIFNDYDEQHIDEKTLCKVLDYLLTYYVRITACEINKNLSKFMKSLYERVIDGSTYDDYYERFVVFLNGLRSNDRMPSDSEFEEALIYKPLYKKPICKFVLSVIENSTKEHIDVSNLTIEHILPQKENAAVWKKEVGADYSHVYEVYLHTLGNLTITGNNSELGTKPFTDKKAIIKANSKAVILNREVLAADRWNEASILNRAKILAGTLIKQFNYEDIQLENGESSDSVFSINDDIDLTNTKPGGFSFVGEYTKVSSWAELLAKFMDISYDLDKDMFSSLASKNFSISNAENAYISNDKRKLRKGKQIGRSGIYYESNLSANTIASFIKELLQKMSLDADEFTYALSEVPFNIDDESTWEEGKIPVAKLFYNLVASLIDRDLINASEIDRLKTKEYTKHLFAQSDYPAIANNRTDNKGKSSQLRYRAKALSFQGTDIFISTQFFDEDREIIIDWYKKHCN